MATIGIDIVRENYAALQRGDVPALLALSSPDITDYQSALVPGADAAAAARAYWNSCRPSRLTSTARSRPVPLYAAGERVVQVGRTRGTVRATGEPIDAAEIHVHHARDNLIVAFEA